MKRRLTGLTCLWCSCLLACTSPMQPVAMQAFELGVQTHRTVRADLATIAEYEAARCTTSVDELRQKLSVIRELMIQGERADAALLFARLYIASGKGVLNILVEDWDRAKAKVAAENISTNG